MVRPREPAALRVIAGTYRPDLGEPDRPQRSGDQLTKLPPPPAELSEAAADAWRRVGQAALDAGVLTAPDLPMLRLGAEALGTAAEAEAVIRKDGITLACASGGAKAHPAVKVLEAARYQAMRCLVELGLSPRARNNVAAAPDPADYDPTEEFFR